MSVGIIGCGFIGRAWTVCFARSNFDVRLWDPKEGAAEAAVSYLSAMLADLEEADLLGGQNAAQILARIYLAKSLEDAVDGVDYIQENAPEAVQLKRDLFARLDAAAPPDAVIASSTSALLPSNFTEGLAGRHRCLVSHPVNPPHLVPLVEIVPSPWTSEDVVALTERRMLDLGQKPVRVEREVDGFVLNRLQAAILDEAFRLVEAGVASPDAVDACIRDGLARRWIFMGPFETIDLNAPGGVTDYVARYHEMYRGITSTMHQSPDWSGPVLQTVEAGRRAKLAVAELPNRQMWRDRQLMAVATFCRDRGL